MTRHHGSLLPKSSPHDHQPIWSQPLRVQSPDIHLTPFFLSRWHSAAAATVHITTTPKTSAKIPHSLAYVYSIIFSLRSDIIFRQEWFNLRRHAIRTDCPPVTGLYDSGVALTLDRRKSRFVMSHWLFQEQDRDIMGKKCPTTVFCFKCNFKCWKSISWKFLISSFRLVLYVVCFLLGNYQASGVYMPTFRNTLSVPSS